MIGCEGCEDWFHPPCVGITKRIAQDLAKTNRLYFCPACVGRSPQLSRMCNHHLFIAQLRGAASRSMS